MWEQVLTKSKKAALFSGLCTAKLRETGQLFMRCGINDGAAA